MRILTLITPSRLGGAERYTGWLSKWEVENGHPALIGMKNTPAVVQWYQSLGLDARVLGISGKVNPLALGRIRDVIREFRPDVVHTHLSSASLWGCLAANKEGIASVAHVHSLNSKTFFRYADKLIAVSKAVQAHLVAQGVRKEKISVVWPAKPPQSTQVTPAEDIASLGNRVIVCAAHLKESKGPFVLLDAMAIVLQSIPDACLVLAGEGPDEDRLRRQADELGIQNRVRFAGFRSDILSVFAAGTLAVLPSLAVEGLPLVIQEANSVGLPAIASSVGGVPELIEDGKTGILVPPNDVRALVDAIVRLLKDDELHARMAVAAKSNSEQWSLEQSGNACLEGFRGAIAMKQKSKAGRR